jgi:hypothetical protein
MDTRAGRWGVLLAALWTAPAWAYEADQLTGRANPPPDSMTVANDEMDRMLDAAMKKANAKTRCKASDRRTKAVFARELAVVTGKPAYIWSRGFWRGMAHNPYEVFLETSPDVARHEFPEGATSIFNQVKPGESMVLHHNSVASTIRLGDHLIGTDKVAHFQVEGYDMWRRSDDGRHLAKAIRWSTGTENGILGLGFSQVFSFGDLSANYAGMHFYQGLLEPDSVVQRDHAGCLVQVAPWDWNDWITDDWDEVANPSVYTPKVTAAVKRYVETNREQVCAEYALWATEDYRRGLAERLARQPVYASARAPKRTDPFELDALCGGQERPLVTADVATPP